MASNISIQYVYSTLNLIAEYIEENKENKERDFSFENLKDVVDNSNILKNKLKGNRSSKLK